MTDRPTTGTRILSAARQPKSWFQLGQFLAVGASGYVVNLATFIACIHVFSLGHRSAAVVAFLVAVSNNFFWNRHWTFVAHDGHPGAQAWRFLVVSIAAFVINFVVLELLIRAGLGDVPAQAVAVASATPFNFVGNKLWTFDR